MPNKVIFKRASSPKEKDIGDVSLVQVGDAVSYKDTTKANAAGRVAKVNSRAKKLRVEAQKYKNYTLRPGRTLDFAEILEVTRPESEPAISSEEPAAG